MLFWAFARCNFSAKIPVVISYMGGTTMPVDVHVYTDHLSEQIAGQLLKIYVDMPEHEKPGEILQSIAAGLCGGDRYYAGYFNGRYICGVLIHDEGEFRSMRYLAVHPATRGRGVAERLVDEVRLKETERTHGLLVTAFDTSDPELVSIFLAMGFLPHKDGQFRCTLR